MKKDFDLAAAKRGAKVCTRDGLPVRILCFDLKDPDWPIIAAYRADYGIENVEFYAKDGRRATLSESDIDLMMEDDDYLERLERGEYYHIGESTEKVDWAYWRMKYAGDFMRALMDESQNIFNVPINITVDRVTRLANELIDRLKKTQK